jgi:hypothetical protein
MIHVKKQCSSIFAPVMMVVSVPLVIKKETNEKEN